MSADKPLSGGVHTHVNEGVVFHDLLLRGIPPVFVGSQPGMGENEILGLKARLGYLIDCQKAL